MSYFDNDGELIIDSEAEVSNVTNNSLIVNRTQDIPDSFLRDLRTERLNSHNVRENEYMKVASIPAAVIDQWLNQGFDFYNASAREIVAKLKRENLDAFLATDKQV